MEELADAIEDAQYVNAISTQEDGPKPVLPWDAPTDEQLLVWEDELLSRNQQPALTLEWVCCNPIGYFLFSQYIKETHKDYIRINFCEEVLRFRKTTRGRKSRFERAIFITNAFLIKPVEEESADHKVHSFDAHQPSEIVEYDLYRRHATTTLTAPEIKAMCLLNMDYPAATESICGIKGPIRNDLLDQIFKLDQLFPNSSSATNKGSKTTATTKTPQEEAETYKEENRTIRRTQSGHDLMSPAEENAPSEVEDALNPGISKSMYHCNTDPDIHFEGTNNNRKIDEPVHPPTFARCKSAIMSSNIRYNCQDSMYYNNKDVIVMLTTLANKIRTKRGIFGTSSSSSHHHSHSSNIDWNTLLPLDMFDSAEMIVMESLKNDYWAVFQQSSHYRKFKNFVWYQEARNVIPDDFFTMRVLGRGGFGLVYACKKGTTGKLYAMKVMNKRRIKIKKSEMLCLNERKALEAVNSKFVVNLNYSFHSKDDVYLILDLMTGGDLGFHLHQRGHFSKAECLYYAARIMLGLQALHDEKYVYRDLKPENCLLDEDGRVKITDLGLATKISSNLTGAAGTRGYWAPEMLRRDSNGKRIVYNHAVDWFSYGCCVAEFISGTNPFRSEVALKFGIDKGKSSKEKAIDYATCEMVPEFPPDMYEPDAADFCRRLLDKNYKTRLGANGCQEIMAHPWFKSVNWDKIIADKEKPPFVPLRDINAASREEISTFPEDKEYQETVITEKDEELYQDWGWTNPTAFAAEVIEVLIYERETGQPLVPIMQQGGCCCTIL